MNDHQHRPSAYAIDGQVYWRGSDGGRGVFKDFADCRLLREQFAQIPPGDWFYVTAQRFVADLDVAMRQASEQAEINTSIRASSAADPLHHAARSAQ